MSKVTVKCKWIFGASRLTRTALLGVVASVGIVPQTASAQAQFATSRTSTMSVAAPVVRQLNTLPQLTAAEAAAKPKAAAFRNNMDPLTLSAKKAQAVGLRFTLPTTSILNSTPPSLPSTSGALTPNSSISILSNTDANCGCAPADQALAVGTNNNTGVVQSYNTGVSVFSKAGALQPGFPKSLTTFFGLAPTRPTSDPRLLFDWINHRYYFVMIDYDPSQASASFYNLAVSQTDDPTGGWFIYRFGVGSAGPSGGVFPLPDYPRIGQDRQAIYIASNIFRPGYLWEEVIAIPKSALMAGAGWSAQVFSQLSLGGIFTDTTQPVNVFSPYDNPRTEYLITSKNILFNGGSCSSSPCNGLVVWSLYGAVGSQTLTGIAVATGNNYSLPPNASQPGAANSIDSNDTRISGMAVYVAGSIYASINTNGGSGQPGIILYQVQPFITASNGSMQGFRILNEIIVGGSSSWYYATQQPDGEGNVTTVFNFSNSGTFYPSLAFGSRRAAQPTGSLPDGGTFLQTGQAQYTLGRWGDYTAVAPAGIVSGGGTGGVPTMWFAGMFSRTGGGWQTIIGKNGFISITDQ